LGDIPNILEDDGEVFLIGEDGVVKGPYSSSDEAQDDLWSWFTDGSRNGGQKEVAKSRVKGHLRLVSVEGQLVKEEGVEKDDPKEGQEGAAKREADPTTS
jgi:hypothetical protein